MMKGGQVEQEVRAVGYSPGSNDVSTEAEEFPLLQAVTRKRSVETVTD
jgi:hypothetical protein